MYIDDSDIGPFDYSRPRKWRVYDKNGVPLNRTLNCAQNWRPLAIIQALKGTGIEVPKRQWGNYAPITIQNEFADGVIYIQFLQQDWLILKEIQNAV